MAKGRELRPQQEGAAEKFAREFAERNTKSGLTTTTNQTSYGSATPRSAPQDALKTAMQQANINNQAQVRLTNNTFAPVSPSSANGNFAQTSMGQAQTAQPPSSVQVNSGARPVTTMGQAASSSSGIMGRWDELRSMMAERNNVIQSSSSTNTAVSNSSKDETVAARPSSPAPSYASKLSASGNRFATTQVQNKGPNSSANAAPPSAAGGSPSGGMGTQGNPEEKFSSATPAPASASSSSGEILPAGGSAKVSSAQSEYETAKMAQQKAREQVNSSGTPMGRPPDSSAAGSGFRRF